MATELIQKSVRLPPELVAYVEDQEGRDFSKKLVGILEECVNGEEHRQKILGDYEASVRLMQEKLAALRRLIFDTHEASKKYAALLKQIEDDIDRMTVPFT